MKSLHLFISLFLILTACGDIEPPTDVENVDVEKCAKTWWYLEQDGEVVLQGYKAGIADVPGELYGAPGMLYSQGYFADTISTDQSCTFFSTKKLDESTHDNLTCITATEQGPNPQWIGADTGSDGDHRPNIKNLNYSGNYVSGTVEGTMFRLDTTSVSPPVIEGRVVNYKFEFNALNNVDIESAVENCSDDSPCAKGCTAKFNRCKDGCKTRTCHARCADVYGRCLRDCED